MNKKKEIVWSDKFISSNEEINNYHKEIIDSITNLYKMLDDTAKHKEEISKITQKIENAMYEHMDKEIEYLKKFDLPEWIVHEENHNYYKKELEFYKHYKVSIIIRAVITAEIANHYLKNHFFQFDIKDINLINKKLNKNKK